MRKSDKTNAAIKRASKKWLADHKGQRKATINDIADIAGVSKKTISRIINESPLVNEETRANVKEVIALIGYEPNPQARGLASRYSFLVGMIYDNPNPQYVVNVQQGILDGLHDTGYELLVHPSSRDDPAYLDKARQFIERHKLFGVILTPSLSEDEALVEILRDCNCNFVRIASVNLDKDKHMLVTNDSDGGHAAAMHLIELGHEKIAFVAGKRGFRSATERRKGFVSGLKTAGLRVEKKYEMRGNYSFASGVAAGKKLLCLKPLPTAIFAANDEMAAGVMLAIRLGGYRVPDTISVVGYDDFQIAENVWPQLTTVHSPIRETARSAVAKLLSRDEEQQLAPEIKPWLVKRGTTARPKK